MLTMKDIAELCGVSRQTVHAALNNKPGVSEETKAHILEIVKKHNYRPNRLAANLHKKSANLVGVTILNIRNPFFADLIQGINTVLRKHELHLMFFEVTNKEDEVDAVESLLAYQAAGVILCPIQDETRVGHLRALQQRGVPLVSVGPVAGLETHYVEVENREAGSLAAQHVIAMGHRRIVYLEGPKKIISARERYVGVLETFIENEIPFTNESFIQAGDTSKEGYAAAMKVLSKPASERPTVILCFNDIIALGVYEAARELGLGIPEDISIVGCDNIDLARLLGPPLTTVSLPVHEMGAHAAGLLASQLDQVTNSGFLVKRFMPDFVSRQSVKDLEVKVGRQRSAG